MKRSRLAALVAGVLMVLSLLPAGSPAAHAADERCFPETQQCISGRFREYWEQHGGLMVFGYPIGPAQNERNRDTGATYLTQWFERARFELHPENKAPYDVLLGRLGEDRLLGLGRDWRSEGRAQPQAGCLFFEQTGHNVCNQSGNTGFKTYWQTHGLEFDNRSGVSFAESLALFGLPLTEPRMETNANGDTVLTQWFERARFEWHPRQRPPFNVLLGLLGKELRGAAPAQALPAGAPWLRTGNQVVALAANQPRVTLPQFSAELPPAVFAAPDGRQLAYVENLSQSQQQVVIYDIASGARRSFALDEYWNVLGGAWAPDGSRFAYSIVYGAGTLRHEVRIFDRARGEVSAIRSASTNLVPMPVSWNAAGLFAVNILWASDAPPQGLLRIDPRTGAVETILNGNNFGTAMTADGQKVAYVGGSRPIMQTPTSSLSVLDRATGRTHTLVPLRNGLIQDPTWSPDGTKLAHVRVSDYGADPSSIHVTNADGSGEQVLRLEGGAFPGRLYDVAWRDAATLLLVTADGPRQLTVFEIKLSNFHPAAATTLQSVARNSDFANELVYVPR